jgi:CRISPR-associated endonuclease Cas1
MATANAIAVTSGIPEVKALVPNQGVVTLFGYGISAFVDRGHLVLQDGVGRNRRAARFPRVRHGLKRLIVIGSDGSISFAALRWLADQNAAFVMLERDGTVLATTGPVRPSDARLRRAQALAHQSGLAITISRELIAQKLSGQARVARDTLRNVTVANQIFEMRTALAETNSLESIRSLEAQAAVVYWSLWQSISVNFPQRDLPRVPEHWRTFGSRGSPLTGSPRLAVNPPNAMLNYLYALLESESRLALAVLGLDPGLGMMHVDTPSRDSFALDLMEAVRPQVDAFLCDWILRETLSRNWFFEQSDGNCRLMGSFAERLATTCRTWRHYIGPVAEWICRVIWSTTNKTQRQNSPASRLTQKHKRKAEGRRDYNAGPALPKVTRLCQSCGEILKRGLNHCSLCALPVARSNMIEAAKRGRLAKHSLKAQTLRAVTMKRQDEAIRNWDSSELPKWLNKVYYTKKIQPELRDISVPIISRALRVSEPYATEIRKGNRIPHPRHWNILAQMVDSSCSNPGEFSATT